MQILFSSTEGAMQAAQTLLGQEAQPVVVHLRHSINVVPLKV